MSVVLVGQPKLPGQLAAVVAGGADLLELHDVDDLVNRAPGELVVDAMVGFGADPPLRGRPALANAWLRAHDVPVVALDLPSGLSADVGLRGTCVTADVTVTLGLPKVGLHSKITQPFVGDLYLADIGIPPALWAELDVEVPSLFAQGPLVRVLFEGRASDAGTPDQGEIPDLGAGRS